jgi:proline iminopeptidase
MKARARTTTGEERAGLWERYSSSGRPMPIYQRKSECEIPMVMLDPVR